MILLLKKERFPVEDTIKKYSSEEALEIIKNFVKDEYDESMEMFKKHVESKFDDYDSNAPYVMEEDVYANRLIGQATSLYRVLTKIRLITGDWDD